MTAAGLLLIIASILKAHQILTVPILVKGFWESWEFFLIQIPLEFGLGIWLVSGLFRKAAWLVGTLAYLGFIFVTLQKVWIGAETCGCFGQVQVDPRVTLFAIDIPFFLLLLIFRPKGEKLLGSPWPSKHHFLSVAAVTLLIIAIGEPILFFNKPPDKTEKYVVVKPESWQLGQNWNMLDAIDIAGEFSEGISVVFLYHFDCPECREAIPYYKQMCEQLTGNEDSMRIAFVEAPPYGGKDDDIIGDTLCMRGRLDGGKIWYFATPLVVVIENGVLLNWRQEENIPTSLDELLDVLAH